MTSASPSGRRRKPSAPLRYPNLSSSALARARVVPDAAAVLRVVAGDARRDRVLRADRLALADDADLVLDLVRHGDRAPQGDLLLGEAAHRLVLHVEVQVDDLRIDAALELDAAPRELGLELAVGGDEGRRHLGELVLDVGVAALEREPAALRLFHDADLDAADARQPLAVAHHLAVARIRLEHDLRGARVALEAERLRCPPASPPTRRRNARSPRAPPRPRARTRARARN